MKDKLIDIYLSYIFPILIGISVIGIPLAIASALIGMTTVAIILLISTLLSVSTIFITLVLLMWL